MLKKNCRDCRRGPIFNINHFPEAVCQDLLEKQPPSFRLDTVTDCPLWTSPINDPTPDGK